MENHARFLMTLKQFRLQNRANEEEPNDSDLPILDFDGDLYDQYLADRLDRADLFDIIRERSDKVMSDELEDLGEMLKGGEHTCINCQDVESVAREEDGGQLVSLKEGFSQAWERIPVCSMAADSDIMSAMVSEIAEKFVSEELEGKGQGNNRKTFETLSEATRLVLRTEVTGWISRICAERSQRRSKGGWQEGKQQSLIPDIHDEITIGQILTKVSWTTMSTLARVSTAWRKLVHSGQAYEARVRTNSTRTLVPIIHWGPERKPDGPNRWQHAISLYDPANDSWHLLPPIPGVRTGIPHGCGCVSVKGKLYILGGDDEDGDSLHHNWLRSTVPYQVHVLDLGAGHIEWKRCADMISSRAFFPCGVQDGNIHVFGGVFCYRAVAEVYNPEQNAWLLIPHMRLNHSEHQALALGGKFYVHGYEEFRKEVPYPAEEYDPRKAEWSSVEHFAHGSRKAFVVVDETLHQLDGELIYAYDKVSNSWAASQPVSWTVPQSHENGEYNLLDPRALAAANGEILALTPWQEGETSEKGTILLKSKGLGCRNLTVGWEEISSPLLEGFNSHQSSLSPIQL